MIQQRNVTDSGHPGSPGMCCKMQSAICSWTRCSAPEIGAYPLAGAGGARCSGACRGIRRVKMPRLARTCVGRETPATLKWGTLSDHTEYADYSNSAAQPRSQHDALRWVCNAGYAAAQYVATQHARRVSPCDEPSALLMPRAASGGRQTSGTQELRVACSVLHVAGISCKLRATRRTVRAATPTLDVAWCMCCGLPR